MGTPSAARPSAQLLPLSSAGITPCPRSMGFACAHGCAPCPAPTQAPARALAPRGPAARASPGPAPGHATLPLSAPAAGHLAQAHCAKRPSTRLVSVCVCQCVCVPTGQAQHGARLSNLIQTQQSHPYPRPYRQPIHLDACAETALPICKHRDQNRNARQPREVNKTRSENKQHALLSGPPPPPSPQREPEHPPPCTARTCTTFKHRHAQLRAHACK